MTYALYRRELNGRVIVVRLEKHKDPPLPFPFYDKEGREHQWRLLQENTSHAGGSRGR